MAPGGILVSRQSSLCPNESRPIHVLGLGGTYLRKNTQRHVVVEVIAPPRIGPRILDMAKTEPRSPDAVPICLTGMISVITVVAILYRPAPPIPWIDRKIILRAKSAEMCIIFVKVLMEIRVELTVVSWTGRRRTPAKRW